MGGTTVGRKVVGGVPVILWATRREPASTRAFYGTHLPASFMIALGTCLSAVGKMKLPALASAAANGHVVGHIVTRFTPLSQQGPDLGFVFFHSR